MFRQYFHIYFSPGNDSEVGGLWIPEVFHQCLVLARFPHCGGKFTVSVSYSGWGRDWSGGLSGGAAFLAYPHMDGSQ